MALNIGIPYRFDRRGRTAAVDDDRHVLDLLEQLLLTNVGERVNRPEFGGGVPQMLFAPTDDVAAAAAQFTIRATLQQFMADLIVVDDVTVSAEDGTLTITVAYMNRLTQTQHTDRFTPVVSQ